MAIILITHDLGVVAEIADEIAVMYAGRIVEHATADEIFARPAAPLHLGPAEVDPAARQSPRRGARADLRPAAEPDLAARPAATSTRAARTSASAHKQIDPRLEPVHGDARPSGRLPAARPTVRARIWRGLESGEAARRSASRGRRRVARAGDATPPPEQGAEQGRRPTRPRRRTDGAITTGRAAGRGPRPRQALPDQAGRDLPAPGRRGQSGRRRLVRRAQGRDARASSARPAAARAPPRDCSSGCWTRRRATIRFEGEDIAQRKGRRAEGAAPPDADGLPGPLLVAEPAQDGRLDHRRPVRDPRAATRARASARSGSRS